MFVVAICGARIYDQKLPHEQAYNAYLADCAAMFRASPLLRFMTAQELHSSPQNATHVLLLGFAEDLDARFAHLGPSKIIHVSMEPESFQWFTPKQQTTIAHRASKCIAGKPNVATFGHKAHGGYVLIPTRMIQQVPQVPRPLSERRLVSLPFSNKRVLTGHRYRHQLALALLQDPRALSVDLWGRGVADFAKANPKIAKDARLKGEFDKLQPYTDYQFSIVIENSREGHYFSEKMYLPIFCGCTPLYFGTSRIGDYFPQSTYALTGDLAQDVDLVAQVCAGRLPPCDTATAKRTFQKKWNWYEYLHKQFS